MKKRKMKKTRPRLLILPLIIPSYIAALALHSLYIGAFIHLLFASSQPPPELEKKHSTLLIEYLFPQVRQQYQSLSKQPLTRSQEPLQRKTPHSTRSYFEQTALLVAIATTLHFIFQQTTTHPEFDARALKRIALRLFSHLLYEPEKNRTKKNDLLYSPVYQTHAATDQEKRQELAIATHQKAAHLAKHEPCSLYLMPGNAIHCFSLFCDSEDGAIWLSQGALLQLTGDELLALLLREQVSASFYKKRKNQHLMWWTLCLSYCLSWFFFMGQNALTRVSIGKKDPRPWHAKNGHPLYFLGIIFLVIGLSGAAMSHLLCRLLSPRKRRLYADSQSAQLMGSKAHLMTLLEKTRQNTSSEYPKALFPFFPLSLHDPRFLTQMLFPQEAISQRLQKLKKLNLHSLYA